MADFDSAFARLLGHEGGYSNHAADPGGETMWGITVLVARANGYRGPMRDMPQSEARRIARAQYWDAVRADELPAPLRFDAFDAAYHAGPDRAVRLLQRAAGVTQDGKLGPVTLAAIRAADPFRLLCRFCGARLDHLNDLPHWPSFGRGWTQRIAENLLAA